MKKKQAEDIILFAEPPDIHGNSSPEYYVADGYLKAIKKTKVLEDALEKIGKTNGLQYGDIFRICDESLSQWRLKK